MDKELLLVASIVSARNFPTRPDYSLVVKGLFNKECMYTDPVPHVGPSVQINTELAWEVSKKDIQYHKLHRTPIKLVCIAEKRDKKEECGYVVLDLRSAKHKGTHQEQEPVPKWYAVLNSSYSKKKQQPELKVSLSLEDADEWAPPGTTVVRDGLKLTLHPCEEYYVLGAGSANERKMFLYSVLLQNPVNLPPLPKGGSNFHFYFDLLGHPIASESFVPPDFRSERFAIRIMTTESLLLEFLKGVDKFVVCLCCDNQVIGKGYVPIHSLGLGETMTYKLLLDVGDASLDVWVTVGIFKGIVPTSSSSESMLPGQPSAGKSHQKAKPKLSASQQTSKSAKRNLSKKFEDASVAAKSAEPGATHHYSPVTSDSSPESMAHSHSHHVPTSSSSSTSTAFSLPRPSKSGSLSVTRGGHTHHAPLGSSDAGPSHTGKEMHGRQPSSSPRKVYRQSYSSAISSPRQIYHQSLSSGVSVPPPPIWVTTNQQHPQHGSVNAESHLTAPADLHPPQSSQSSRHSSCVSNAPRDSSHHTTPHNPAHSLSPSEPAISSHLASSTQYSIPHQDRVIAGSPAHQSRSSTAAEQPKSGGSHSHTVGTHVEQDRFKKAESGTDHGREDKKDDIYFSEATWFSTSEQIGNCKHFRCSLDMRSLQDSSLEVGPSYYLRYSYAFFGCPYPVLVQPPVPLVFPGANLSFIQSFCSFDFAVQYENLVSHLMQHPLMVEVWSVSSNGRDIIAGLSQVSLQKIFAQDKMRLPDGTIRQVVSLQCPVYSPCSDFTSQSELSYSNKPQNSMPLLATLNITVVMEDLGFLTREKLSSGEVSRFTSQKKSRRVDNEMQELVSSHAKVKSSTAGVRESVDGVGAAKHLGGDVAVEPMSTSRDSIEYQAALELEMWKASEEEAFQVYLKDLESSHMSKLGDEWRKRETERHEMFKKKLDQYTILEKRLVEGLQKLQVHQQSLAAKETKMNHEKAKLKQEKENLTKLHEAEMNALRTTFESQIDHERQKVNDLQEQLESLKKRMHNELKSKEEEIQKYKKELPSSKLMADLEIIKLEKEELQRKVTSLSSAKDQYKMKWKEALSELARHHREEQHMTQKRLMAQERELEELRKDIVKMDEQNNLNLQISNLKEDAERIQEHVITMEEEEPGGAAHSSRSHSHHCSSHSSHHHHHVPHYHHSHSPTGSHSHHSHSPPSDCHQSQPGSQCIQHGHKHAHTHPHSAHSCHRHVSPTSTTRSLTADVARWIEEREILLQTGVYSDTDVTIQTLDSKIRGAMLKINGD